MIQSISSFPAKAAALTLLIGFLLSLGTSAHAQRHEYPFVYYPIEVDTTVQFLYDWYEVEPDGLLRRDHQLIGRQAHALYGSIRPEMYPEGTTIHLRARSLQGTLLDEQLLVVHDTTFLVFGAPEATFDFYSEYDTLPDASVYDTGYMFEVEDDTLQLDFFNLTDQKVRFDHSVLIYDDRDQAYHMNTLEEGRSKSSILPMVVIPNPEHVELHFFEFITSGGDTLDFVGAAVGEADGYSRMHFPVRSRDDLLLGRVLPSVKPR